ncbi:hypothetical protein L226DRAFT_251681 [Lentinus tigrinus ALCF2SS1-7]|uniref:uncharacterized protein n=1 Tax=Lentinus tigrinus ALCF2SS1-7 TaxID=1328758 RepID=UPI001165F4C6|nr:hypothetical protein L226DRAFT_251681 [Lentinus tigrinus ALCF2SS1-7]
MVQYMCTGVRMSSYSVCLGRILLARASDWWLTNFPPSSYETKTPCPAPASSTPCGPR